MPDLFAKLMHTLCTLPFSDTPGLTVALRVAGNIARLFVS